MTQHSTITVDSTFALGVNSLIGIRTPDLRWWKRFWFWLSRQGMPYTIEYLTVIDKTDTTLTVERNQCHC